MNPREFHGGFAMGILMRLEQKHHRHTHFGPFAVKLKRTGHSLNHLGFTDKGLNLATWVLMGVAKFGLYVLLMGGGGAMCGLLTGRGLPCRLSFGTGGVSAALMVVLMGG